jgi:hypothetical protein
MASIKERDMVQTTEKIVKMMVCCREALKTRSLKIFEKFESLTPRHYRLSSIHATRTTTSAAIRTMRKRESPSSSTVTN